MIQFPTVAVGLEAGADEFIHQARRGVVWSCKCCVCTTPRVEDAVLLIWSGCSNCGNRPPKTIVHDLRNPLAAVTLYMQLLKRKGGVAPDQACYLDLALSESQKMSNFLDDMLMLAKMERGKLSLTRTPLYVECVINQLRGKHGLLAEAQNVALAVRMVEQPYPLLADVTLFQRVVWKTWSPTP